MSECTKEGEKGTIPVQLDKGRKEKIILLLMSVVKMFF